MAMQQWGGPGFLAADRVPARVGQKEGRVHFLLLLSRGPGEETFVLKAKRR
jgi:hypothetical protein